MKKLFWIITSGIVLSACSETTYTVEQFKADDTLRAEYLSKCENGELHKEDLNCLNARKADVNIRLDNEIKALKNSHLN